MRKIGLVFAFIISFSLVQFAYAADITVFGAGSSYSCGDWLDARAEGYKSSNAILAEQWVDGYLVGVQDATNNAFMSGSTDASSSFYWIDNYCKQNPTASLYVATAEFAVTMLKQHKAN